MNDKLLYFPYINVPNTSWTVKSILYWDQVGAIVPDIYKDNPDKFEKNMLDLVQANLIQQVFPMEYIQSNLFDDAFYQLTQAPTFNLEEKRLEFRRGNQNRLHVQKFGGSLLNELIRMGIAQRESWQWYYVESKTANLFMMYLATIISQIGEFTPATDDIQNIDLSFQQDASSNLKQKIRGRFLDDLLPYPIDIDISKLYKFKERYYYELNTFRTLLEQRIIQIANFNNEEDQNDFYQLSLKEITQKRDFIYSKMDEANIGKVVLGGVFGLVGAALNQAVGDISGIFEFGNAVYSALSGYNKTDILHNDFSYLALLDKNFKST